MPQVSVTLISCLLLSLFLHTPAAFGPMNYACCVKYTRSPVPIGLIVGFAEQRSIEVCRIDAIIFFTKNNKKVCATIEDPWVKKALGRLRSKIAELESKGPTIGLETATNSP